MTTDDYIPRVEAAARAGVHRSTILEWERRGLLKAKRAQGPTGEQVVIRVADLERVVASRPERMVNDGSRIELLEAEIAFLRERLDDVTGERDLLLSEVLDIARGHRRPKGEGPSHPVSGSPTRETHSS